MKRTDTVKLSALEAVQISSETDGGRVELAFQVGGITAATKILTTQQAGDIGFYLMSHAQRAVKVGGAS